MKNNDILRRIRFVFNLDDSKMMKLCSTKDRKVLRAEISDWLKRDDDIGHKAMLDVELATFLNHFIEAKRGKRDGPAAVPEKRLSNNAVFMKLKIALNLKAEEVLEILQLANFKLGKHELSAFFRKPGHKHYRECKDQVLRNFLQGMQNKYRKEFEITKDKSQKENAPAPVAYQWKQKPNSD